MELIKLDRQEINTIAPDFWHRTEWIDYCINSNFIKGIDCTIGLYDKGKLRAILSLIREGEEFTFQRSFGPSVLFIDEESQNKVANELILYAKKNDVRRIAIEGFIPGFITHTKQICVSNLSKSNIRKSYKSLLNNKLLTCSIINRQDKSCYISRQVDAIKSLYYSIAKKITRPSITFEMYKDWIAKGMASLLIAYLGNVAVGFTLVTHYSGEAYYFLCGVVSDYKVYNVSHYLQGQVIHTLKDLGVNSYSLGNIDNNSLFTCPDKKEKDISFFKSGFGNANRYTVVSEYFTDREYFKKKYQERINNYLGAEFDEKSDIILSKT